MLIYIKDFIFCRYVVEYLRLVVKLDSAIQNLQLTTVRKSDLHDCNRSSAIFLMEALNFTTWPWLLTNQHFSKSK